MIPYFGISPTAGGGGPGRLRSSPPSPSPQVGVGLGRGGLELKLHEVPTTDSSQVRWVQVQVHRVQLQVNVANTIAVKQVVIFFFVEIEYSSSWMIKPSRVVDKDDNSNDKWPIMWALVISNVNEGGNLQWWRPLDSPTMLSLSLTNSKDLTHIQNSKIFQTSQSSVCVGGVGGVIPGGKK